MEISKQIITFVVLLLLVILGGWALLNYPKNAAGPAIDITATTTGGLPLPTPAAPVMSASGPGVLETIRVFAPTPGMVITSPLAIRGEARGSWFFEANAPATLTDANGTVIMSVGLQADADWMTSDFVPFSGQLTFTSPGYGQQGYLIIANDNPSGLPENSKWVKIPVIFK